MSTRLDLRAAALGLLFALLWSSAFTSAKFIVADAPPFMALVARFLLAGALGCLIATALGQSVRLSRPQWFLVLIFGLLQNCVYLGLNFLAMMRIDAGLAAIIASALPLIVSAFAWPIFGERLGVQGVLGLVAGFAGVLIVMGGRLTLGAGLGDILLCLVAAGALAAATLLVRGVSPGGNMLMIVGLQMIVGGLALVPVAALTESAAEIAWTAPMLIAFAYSAVFPGLIATMILFALIRRVGATNAAAFHFLNPFLGLAVAAVLLDETVARSDIAGVALTMAGILAVQLRKT